MAEINFIYSDEYFMSRAPTDLNSMSPVVSTEDGKTAQVDIPVDLLLILGNL